LIRYEEWGTGATLRADTKGYERAKKWERSPFEVTPDAKKSKR